MSSERASQDISTAKIQINSVSPTAKNPILMPHLTGRYKVEDKMHNTSVNFKNYDIKQSNDHVSFLSRRPIARSKRDMILTQSRNTNAFTEFSSKKRQKQSVLYSSTISPSIG